MARAPLQRRHTSFACLVSAVLGIANTSQKLKNTEVPRAVRVKHMYTQEVGKKLKHEKSEETKHGLFRDCFLGAPERTRN